MPNEDGFFKDRPPIKSPSHGIDIVTVSSLCVLVGLAGGFAAGLYANLNWFWYDYPQWMVARKVEPIDADTLAITFTVDLDGVDGPNDPGLCPEEREAAGKAKQAVMDAVEGHPVRVNILGYDRDGRLAAEVLASNHPLPQSLLEQGLAVRRSLIRTRINPWCQRFGAEAEQNGGDHSNNLNNLF